MYEPSNMSQTWQVVLHNPANLGNFAVGVTVTRDEGGYVDRISQGVVTGTVGGYRG